MRLYITDWDLERLGDGPVARFVHSFPRWRCSHCGNYRQENSPLCCLMGAKSGIVWIEIIDNKVVDSGVL